LELFGGLKRLWKCGAGCGFSAARDEGVRILSWADVQEIIDRFISCDLIGSPLVVEVHGVGALSGDVGILSWGGVEAQTIGADLVHMSDRMRDEVC
jgi:hypothetical protein